MFYEVLRNEFDRARSRGAREVEMSWRPAPTAVVLVALLAVFRSDALSAQGIEGTVRHGTTGEPLPGVLVSVIGAEGDRVRGVLTDETGRYTVRVPEGRYRLRAERIGLQTGQTDLFDLEGQDVRVVHMDMDWRPVEIAGIVVDTRVQSCRIDSRDATRIQRWWSEIRTALDVSAALQSEQFGRFLVENFQREWDADLETVIAANHRFDVSTSTRPFVSAPAEDLVSEGFVRGDFGHERLYYGPDAEVLLSSVFLAQHCFSLTDEDDRNDQLGLHFEPVDGRDVVDIEGTLWVDTTTAELQDIEFHYVNLEGPESRDAGGSIVFEYLPSGAWIVSDWYIRMPRTGLRGRRSRLTTLGYHDGGGSVTFLSPPEPGGAVGEIRGVVTDRLRGGGLAGAVVRLLGTDHEALTDDAGRFHVSDVPAGRHLLGFAHDEIALWELGTGYVEVDVPAGATAEAELFVPEFEQVALSLCMAEGVDAETVLMGHILNHDRTPIPGQLVRLTYERRAGPGGRESDLRVRTDEKGRFLVCSVPGGAEITLSMDVGGEWEEVTGFTAAEGELTYRELWFRR